MIDSSAAGDRATNGRPRGGLLRWAAPRWMRHVSLIVGAGLLLTILLSSLLAGYISPYRSPRTYLICCSRPVLNIHLVQTISGETFLAVCCMQPNWI